MENAERILKKKKKKRGSSERCLESVVKEIVSNGIKYEMNEDVVFPTRE